MRDRRNRRSREIREVVHARPPHQTAKRVFSALLLIWLGAGLVAAHQRSYFTNPPVDCGAWGTIALTVAAGPLNYLGANPKVTDCRLPEPSQ
ncbi:hypothetical protein [Nocardia rhizosphaerae]|uniref:Uncharacterized protein n=1 Tax=Nocardia rhizosphaerae TaxID=1691571 RepID=A0ABV8LDZ4_9NOCA